MDVTVIIATYGSDEWLDLAERAARSVNRQRTPAAQLVMSHADTLHEARNRGAELADHEWLVFLDADDLLDRDYLTAMARAQHRADLLNPAVSYLRNMYREPARMLDPVPFTEGNHLVIGTAVRRTMFFDVGGFRNWPIYEDWCLWQRCQLAGATVADVPDAVYIAEWREDSRNRAPSRTERLEVHHAIRRANLPHLYPVDA